MQWFKNWPIGVKIALAFGVIAIAVIGTAIYQITAINRLERSFSGLIDTDIQRISTIQNVSLSNEQLRTTVSRYLLQGFKPTDKTEALLHIQNLQDTFEAYADVQSSPGRIADLRKQVEQVKADAEAAVNVTQAGPATEETHAAFNQSQEVLADALENKAITEKDTLTLANQHINTQVDSLFGSVVLVAILSAVLAVAMGTLVTWWLGRSIDRLRKGAAQFAVGDFSKAVPIFSRDELGELASIINIMARTLQDTQQAPDSASTSTPTKQKAANNRSHNDSK